METNNTLTPREEFFNKFKNIELIIFVVAVLAVLAKITGLHFPKLSLILISTLGACSVFTYLFSFSGEIIYENKNPKLLMILGLGSSVLMIGTLFSIMFWPGGRMFLIAGFFASVFSLIWIAATMGKQTFGFTSIYNKALLVKIIFFSSIAAWALISPLEFYKQVSVNGNDPIAVRLYEEHINDPKNTAKTKAYFEYTNSKNQRRR